MNAVRPPERRPISSTPSSSSAWSDSSTCSNLSDDLSCLSFDESTLDSLSEFPLSSESESESPSGNSTPNRRWGPLYASSSSHSVNSHSTGSRASDGGKKDVDLNIPSDALPRLRVLLKNEILEFLDMDYDDMPLETMLHRHSSVLAKRNQEILKLVCHEGQNCASAGSHLRYFKHMYRMVPREQFSGIGGMLWGLLKLESLVAGSYKESLGLTNTDGEGFFSSESSFYDTTDSGESGDPGSDQFDSDHDTVDDGSDQYGSYYDTIDDFESYDDDDEDDDQSVMHEVEYEDYDAYYGHRSSAPKGPPDRGLIDLLNLLREFALNRRILACYQSILANSALEGDEISALLRPKRPRSRHAMRELRQREAHVISYMQSLTFLYKLQLLVQYELEDPEEYWRKDFEHPAHEEKHLSLLWSKSMMTLMMTHFHREESDSERYWRRNGYLGVSRKRLDEEWQFKQIYLSNYLRFAEATVNDWFSDPDVRQWMAQERADEIEERCTRFSEMGGRLQMVPAGKMYREHSKVSEWVGGVGKDREPPEITISDVEARALAGTTFKIGTLSKMPREEAIELITRHGGTIHNSLNAKVDIAVGTDIYSHRRVDVYENDLSGFIRSKTILARFAHTDKNAVKNMVFSFRGILPTLTRSDVRELVEQHGGTSDDILVPEVDFVVVGTPNPSFELETWDQDMQRIDELGLRKIDEAGFIELLEKSQAWLRSGKRKAPDGFSMGEITKRRKRWKLFSMVDINW